jgi:monovalent cation:H+ antiporter-2, CPA2 family
VIHVFAAVGGDAALAFIEIGAVAIVLSALARLAGRLAITAIPLYLLAGLLVGEGGIAPLDVSAEFISLAAQIGVLLLLLTLGLEYTGDDLRHGLRTGVRPGMVDAAANFVPGLLAGLLLGWEFRTALLLGGVCWVSSSGVVAKVLSDLDRLGNRETPSILNLLVLEDLAMALYLPVVVAVVAGETLGETAISVAVALGGVAAILTVALRMGHRLSRAFTSASDEALLLGVFGLTLLVGGLAEQLQVSAAVGAFLVGLALSGAVQERAGALIGPLRDLFAATFFLFFSFQVNPSALGGVAVAALLLTVVTGLGKMVSGWVAAGRSGSGVPGRVRAGTALIARGEFSVVIAALGAGTRDAEDLAALTAGYVLLSAITGPLATKYADRIPVPAFLRRRAQPVRRPAPRTS